MIVGWRSPVDGRVYDLDDFGALEACIPEPLLRAMSHKARTDTRHQGPNITITSGLSCPRKTLITRMLPITPDPTKMWKMQRGTWLHEVIGLSLGENDSWWTEEVAEDRCVYAGKIFGIDMSCKIDAVRKDFSVLLDWKFRGDGAERWIDPMGRAKDEDSAQLNMARMLMEQTTGRDLSDMQMFVWVMSGQTVRTTVPYMNLTQVGEIRPGGGSYSIKEIFGMLSVGMQQWKTEALAESIDPLAVSQPKLRKIISQFPMVGESMYKNKRSPQINMCSRYCEVQDECYGCEDAVI